SKDAIERKTRSELSLNLPHGRAKRRLILAVMQSSSRLRPFPTPREARRGGTMPRKAYKRQDLPPGSIPLRHGKKIVRFIDWSKTIASQKQREAIQSQNRLTAAIEQQNKDPQRWGTKKQAAAHYGDVTTKTIENWEAAGQIKFRRKPSGRKEYLLK